MIIRDPLISVIIPVHNVKPYIHQCLESIIEQSFKNIEVILVDDGSTDGSGLICDDYATKDSRIVVIHTENRGLSAARNCGLAYIKQETKYIFFLDSDDWVEENLLQMLYNATSLYDVDLVACGYYNEYYNKSVPSSDLTRTLVLSEGEILRYFVKERHIGNIAWNKLYKKELFENVRYPEGRIFEDVATTYKIVEIANGVAVIPDRLIHYRIRKNSLSQKHSMKCLIDYWLSYFEMYTALYNKVPEESYQSHLVGNCLTAITRMWIWYYGCSKKERVNAQPTISNMMDFTASYYASIMHSKDFSIAQKLACIGSKTGNPIVLFMLYKLNQLYRLCGFLKPYV